jgi:hypothetical protein
MKALSRNLTGCERTACGDLAVGVIDRAFRDLIGVGGSRADQESARVFLAGSPMFYHWCAVANLNPTWMVERTRQLIAAGGPFHFREVTQGTDSATESSTFHARREETEAGLTAGLQGRRSERRTRNLLHGFDDDIRSRRLL